MDSRVLRLASAVIERSSREHPADATLRQELRKERGLVPGLAAQVSHAVFSYYQWLGWLERRQTEADIQQALQLADKFRKEPAQFSDSELMLRALPGWLGSEMEITSDWVRSLQSEPVLWLRARPGQGESLERELGDCRIFGTGKWADTLQYLGKNDLFQTPAFQLGKFEIQDIASQAVGLICNPVAGECWWDACSGEGGKTMHLSDLMGNKGLIWASDRAAWRLQRLKRRAARARVFNYRAAVWNGGAKLPTKTKCDGVLVDAPCTGIGTWQRNPHARWTTTAQDVEELSRLQKQLIANAAAGVKSGGKLFYVVCTLSRSETIEVVGAFENEHPEFERLPVQNPFELERHPAREMWLWPQCHRGNGMFAVGWRKT